MFKNNSCRHKRRQSNRQNHKKDNVEASQIKSIIDSQIDRKSRNELADIIISNDGSLQELEEKVKKIHQDLEKKFLNEKNVLDAEKCTL